MSVKMFRDGVVAAAAALVLYAVTGCSPAPSPPVAVRPAATHDHDHDHGHGHDVQAKVKDAHDDHDHDDHGHEHPETLTAAVAGLEKMWGQVHAALKSGERDEADEQVHSVGHLLEDLQGLLAKENPSAEAAAAGKQAIDDVFSCFDTIDAALHGAEDDFKKIDVDEIRPRIETAIAKLKDIVKK
jgi:hypothetical protein